MVTIRGFSAAWNYTIGPAYLWRGAACIGDLNARHMPVVVVAPDLASEDLARIELTRVHGFVIEGGGYGSPARLFLWGQKRAAVMGAAGALALAREGEPVVVDGVAGLAIFEPDAATLAHYEALRRQGPPPEPPGLTDTILEVARDPLKLAKRLSPDFLGDFERYGGALPPLAGMLEGKPLSPADQDAILNAVKGGASEERVRQNLTRYVEATGDAESRPAAAAQPQGGRGRERGA